MSINTKPGAVKCANKECGNMFTPRFAPGHPKRQRCCSKACYWVVWSAENPRVKVKGWGGVKAKAD